MSTSGGETGFNLYNEDIYIWDEGSREYLYNLRRTTSGQKRLHPPAVSDSLMHALRKIPPVIPSFFLTTFANNRFKSEEAGRMEASERRLLASPMDNPMMEDEMELNRTSLSHGFNLKNAYVMKSLSACTEAPPSGSFWPWRM